jgi:alkylmercury lyase-like protein
MHGADAQQDAVFDARVRHEMMAQFVRRTTAPSPGDVAGALGASTARVRAAFRRLADAHVLVLRAGSEDIVMAHPLSAVPTPFRVHVAGRAYWPNCAWDALGVAAMFGADARIEASCGDCALPCRIAVVDGRLLCDPLRFHFAVPARRWWDDIAFT